MFSDAHFAVFAVELEGEDCAVLQTEIAWLVRHRPVNLETQQWPQDWKRSILIPIQKKGNAKECSNYDTITLLSQITKVMLKIIQARLQQYVNQELPDIQAKFRKGIRTRDEIVTIRWIIEKARELQKNILLLC